MEKTFLNKNIESEEAALSEQEKASEKGPSLKYKPNQKEEIYELVS